ncbi:Endonuclease V [Musa troglodytarum]|uniref:Endonuclease V n=1 Tax=Musa troglodytarum TaxID=320322 RepID=A0A9E7HZW5_9LILI|nr:Endonuclease V [Musa troglodytarum]
MDDSSDLEKDVNSSSYHQEWVEYASRDDLLARRAQESLKEKLVLEDDFAWGVPSHGLASGDGSRREKLKYIGGVDISFLKKDPSVSCGALVVLDADTMDVVHEEFEVTRLQVPYVPGFLAFREASMLLGLLNKMKANAHPFYPQLVMVDGNGLLHPRGLGLACHLGILANLPTIGVGKNLHHIDGLTQSAVRQSLEARENYDKDLIFLTGKSGKSWGVADIRSKMFLQKFKGLLLYMIDHSTKPNAAPRILGHKLDTTAIYLSEASRGHEDLSLEGTLSNMKA